MIIKYVFSRIIVFEINNQIYYFHDNPNLPQLYDQQLNKLIVPNLDSWLQSKTSQRYSLRGLRDMATAFMSGMQCGISEGQAYQLILNAISETKRQIFQSALASDYARVYFIELMDPVKVEATHLPIITKNFNKLLKKCGRDRLLNYLCRFWQLCNQHSPSTSFVFENLIKRLGREPTTPHYPDTVELDNSLADEVNRVVLKNIPLYNVSKDIANNVKKLL